MDFVQFGIMFRAIFLEGLSRPWEGVRRVLRVLLDKYRAAGGERRMKCGVARLVAREGRVAALVGFDLHRSNELLHDGATLLGRVGEPILDRSAKSATLAELAAERGLPLAATLAVGDGANDLDMIRASGLGIAFHAKPIVAAAAQARVDHGDLRALLFAQGYAAREFSGV